MGKGNIASMDKADGDGFGNMLSIHMVYDSQNIPPIYMPIAMGNGTLHR